MKNFQKIAQLIVALALVWPPIHIVASYNELFSAWRFFGWGMYSEISPTENKKLIIADLDSIVNDELLGCSSHLREVIYCSEKIDEEIKERIVDDIIFSNAFSPAFRRFAFFNRVDQLVDSLMSDRMERFNLTQHQLAVGKIELDRLSETMRLDWSLIEKGNP